MISHDERQNPRLCQRIKELKAKIHKLESELKFAHANLDAANDAMDRHNFPDGYTLDERIDKAYQKGLL